VWSVRYLANVHRNNDPSSGMRYSSQVSADEIIFLANTRGLSKLASLSLNMMK
jgi:hypothetical protein